MRIDRFPYVLPLVRPWSTHRGSLVERTGTLIRLSDDQGRQGWGDVAPWPDLGISEENAETFATACAREDLAAQAAGLPLAHWLAGAPVPLEIPVNAALGAIAHLTATALQAALDAGFRILKVKLGILPPREEIDCLTRLSTSLPAGAAWRLDANGAWPFENARNFLAASRDLPVESLEEPLAAPTLALLARLQDAAPFPLALDESIDLADAGFFAAPPVRRLVLKPPRHGSPAACMALAALARDAGVDCVVTSTLESACGLWAAAHLATAIGPGLAHGLDTARWLASDTGLPPPLQAGRIELPFSPGLGFVPRFS